jgi:hypothetical protein
MPISASPARRWALLALALAALALPACGRAAAAGAPAGPVEVSVAPVELDPARPRRARLDRLLWRGGLELSSSHPAWGGLSGLVVSPDGRRLTAVSDRGWWLTARLRHDVAGFLCGLEGARLRRLAGPEGRPLQGKEEADAEELAAAPDGGLVVALERRHRLLAYPPAREPLACRPRRLALPPWLAAAPANRGAEAAAFLPDGGLVVLAEGAKGQKTTPGGLWREGRWHRLSYRPAPGLHPTAACAPPGGGLVVLERGFSPLAGVAVRVAMLPAGSLGPGALSQAATLARLEPPLALDNLEGLACRQTPGGLMLYLLSDDNFSPLQRTLLLAFLLPEGG